MLGVHSFYRNHIYRARLWTLVFLSGSLLGFPFHFAPAQNLIQNGDFESPPYAPSSDITNWNVGGTGNVHSINEGSTSPSHSAALSIGNDSQGTTISQSFPTAVGEVYRVDFDAGIFGQRSGNPLQLNVQITGSGTLLNQTVTPPDAFTFTPDAVLFSHYHFTFTANSTTSTIQFMDIGLGNAMADVVIDSASVQPDENTLVNGDFETPPFDTPSTVSGWTVTGNAAIADRSSQGSAGGAHATAFNAGGDSAGNVLSQSFATSVGKTYIVDFYSGVFGIPDNNATLQQLDVQVLGSNTIVDQTVTPPVQGTFDPSMVRFQHYQFSFVANSSTTTLQFTDIGTGNSIADIMLDTVSVTPEPVQLINGDFETGPFETLAVTGWTIGGTGRVEDKAEGSTTPSHSAAFGTGGSSQGNTLSQTLSTVVGRQYTLDFDSSVFGRRTGARLQMQIQLLGNGAVLNQTITPPDAFTFNISQLIWQHYHFVFTANAISTVLQYQDIGTGNASADPLIDTVAVQLQPPPTFAWWQATHFTDAQRADPNISGWTSDPDHDGIRNGLEYFFNTDPLAGIPLSDAAALPQLTITTSGASRYLTLTYRRPIAFTGTPELVGVSDNLLSTWDETGSQIEVLSGPTPTGDGFTEMLTVRLKAPINQAPILPRKFLRLELTQ
jgi:hypothetical protein